ncbi:uncharacterized protein LOC134217274 [Armigeres subalbatus]|uniref:uncharacterized protein LOC134217274 n=1 Tax=Armigeres subalbatus TaxID=124917 RepID=UPI002ED122BF
MNEHQFPRWGEPSGGCLAGKVMVLERKEEGKSFHGVSPVLVEKFIQSFCGEVHSAKKTRDGKIFVTVKNESQARNLAKMEKMTDGITVNVYEHKTLNSCKVVIFCRDVREDSDTDILAMLSEQGITEVKQIMKGREENKTSTGIFVLTVKGTKPPSELKLGYIVLETRPWYPNPLRCFKCLKFGHTSKNCSSEKKCSKCGELYHEECTNSEKCINCGNKHGAFSKECPTLKQEKAITKVKVDKNISFWEARKIVENEGKSTYSDTLKSSLKRQTDEKIAQLTEQNNLYRNQIQQLEEEKKSLAESIKLDYDTHYENLLKQYQDENEKKFGKMEENYEAIHNKFEKLASVYQEEKQRKAEKDLEKLQENYAKLENILKQHGYKSAPKHRNQDNPAPSPPRKKKANHKMAPAKEVDYVDSESENTDDQPDEHMDQKP